MDRFEKDFTAIFAEPSSKPTLSKEEALAHYNGLLDQLHRQQYNALMAYWGMHKTIPLSTIVDQISRDLNQVISIKVIEQAKDVIAAFEKAGGLSDENRP